MRCTLFMPLVFLVACAHPKNQSIAVDPVATASTTIEKPAPEPPPNISPIATFHGHVLNLATATELHDETAVRIAHQIAIGNRVFFGGGLTLSAYDTSPWKLVWSKPLSCGLLVAAGQQLLCDAVGEVDVLDPATGTSRVLSARVGASLDAIEIIGDRILLVYENGAESYDLATLAPYGTLTMPKSSLSHAAPYVANAIGACVADVMMSDARYRCFDKDAKALFSKVLPLATAKMLTGSAPPAFFTVQQHDANFVVFSTDMRPYPHSVIVRASDATVLLAIDEEISAAIATDDGKLDSVLASRAKTALFDATGALLWKSPVMLEPSARALLIDGVLTVATFERSTDGAALIAFDRASGSKRWAATLEFKPMAHSAYFNDVSLTYAFDRYLLRGEESGQFYVNLVEPKAGAVQLHVGESYW